MLGRVKEGVTECTGVHTMDDENTLGDEPSGDRI
jgi:hypothetical protein